MNNQPTPSVPALRAAKLIWPNGAPHVAYCWDDEAKNEASKQRDRDRLATRIEQGTNLPALVEALRDCADAIHDLPPGQSEKVAAAWDKARLILAQTEGAKSE